jgi:methyl-accepting chemotaxis protein
MKIFNRAADLEAKLAALDKSQAVIEFALDGTILTANENFCTALGYTLNEIKGKHHRLFVDPQEATSQAYQQFWDKLRGGEFQQAEYKRIAKGGREIWIQATYNPIMGRNGKPIKVVKFATDITQAKLSTADYEGQIAALNRAQAIIEFALDGTILTANENFLNALGYTLAEIKGQHHRMFVEPAYAASAEYRQFWDTLRRGQFQAAEYKRLGKGARDVWILASYNPIVDAGGRLVKVVKFASDITATVKERQRRMEVQKSIDADLDGIIDSVNAASAQSTAVASASNETSTNVQAVAAGAEEMAASVDEISRQVTQSLDIANKAVAQAKDTNDMIAGLAEAARTINDVVSLINEIAAQTNLLALNATIEAARAGEMGKGFAVVASEVKSLANQTAKATEQIAAQVGGMQSATEKSVEAIAEISKVIGQIYEMSSTIASAVVEQTAVTKEMSSNMQSASAAVESINASINDIAHSTQRIDDATQKVKAASRSLA